MAGVAIASSTQVPTSGRKRRGGTPDALSLLVDMEAVKTDSQAANFTDDVQPPVQLDQLDGSERSSRRIHEAGLPGSKWSPSRSRSSVDDWTSLAPPALLILVSSVGVQLRRWQREFG